MKLWITRDPAHMGDSYILTHDDAAEWVDVTQWRAATRNERIRWELTHPRISIADILVFAFYVLVASLLIAVLTR